MSKVATNNTLSIYQVVDAIKAQGHRRTVLVQGDMGSGKSSILELLAKEFPTYIPIYFDATTKDLGDLMVPMFDKIDEQGIVRYAVNEELGCHHKQPVILMVDEYGKANPSVKLGLTRLALERKLTDSAGLPEGSIVFMTTNKGAENVGDLLLAHQRNRMAVVNMRKSTNEEWLVWGQEHGIDESVMGWAAENPQLFHSFEQYEDPQDNPYIFHPSAPERAAFVTPRSLEAASDWIKARELMDDETLTQVLSGTIGERGARDLAAYVALIDDLPTLEDLKKNPMGALVPTSPAAVCMVVYRTMSVIEYAWVDNWMEYLSRLPREAQGLFVNGVRNEKYHKRDVVTNCSGFQDWCNKNNWIYK